MRRTKRKIGFYYLTINEGNDLGNSFNLVMDYINSLSRQDRAYELGNQKFCFLESYQVNGQQSKIMIKSAKHSFRPNLVHRDTIQERENPKAIEEGEIEKSHIVTKIMENTICLILDKHMGGITIRQLVKYLNEFSRNIDMEIPINFGYEIVVKENFLEEIENLNRVICAQIVVDKQLLGSDALNYSNRINEVKHDIILNVKAKRLSSIEDFAIDIFNKFRRENNRINKIRIIGRNDENNEVVLNTDRIERQEFINAEINESTGEISSLDVFSEMESVLRGFY